MKSSSLLIWFNIIIFSYSTTVATGVGICLSRVLTKMSTGPGRQVCVCFFNAQVMSFCKHTHLLLQRAGLLGNIPQRVFVIQDMNTHKHADTLKEET